MTRFGLMTRDLFDDWDKNFGEMFTAKNHNPVHVFEKENYFQINVDLPGVTKDDVNLNVENDILTIEAERKFEKEYEDHYQKGYGKFQRSFKLPKNINQDELEAAMDHGVLKLLLPKVSAKANSRKIEIGEKFKTIENAM